MRKGFLLQEISFMFCVSYFGVAFFLTCLPPVASFWFFSCRHGNGRGDVGDSCWAFCQCHAPNTCEAGIQRCLAPGKLNDHCHLTRPCDKGFSCHPGLQKCYHTPRRLYEPCVAGFDCGSGLSCQPGTQICFHALRRYNEACVGGYPCGPGLSCQPGSQRCLHFPRWENEQCSLGFECGVGLECTLCAELYLTCQMSRVPKRDEEFYRRPYNKVAFLVTHNAFSNSAEYALWVRNQRVSVAQQLRDGVRGLMLDIYPGWGKAEVRLCHGSCFWGGSTNLLDTLIQVRQFLDANPREVVTIIFEDYLKNPTILKRVFDQSRVSSHVINNEYWGTKYQGWPTLDEMRTLGRLVVFNNNGLKGFPYTVYNMWYYVRESRYGQKGLDPKMCVDRAESAYNAHYNNNWSLVLVNWFGTATNPLNPCLNSFAKLKEKLSTCQRAFGQLTNFVAVDFYRNGEKGGVFKAVEWLNQKWKNEFPTEKTTMNKNFMNKYFEMVKASILDRWNRNSSKINGRMMRRKNNSRKGVERMMDQMTSEADHVINVTNQIMNMPVHVVKVSHQSSKGEDHVLDTIGHMINRTDQVLGNSSSVTIETPIYDNTIARLENTTYSIDENSQFYNMTKGLSFFNTSKSNSDYWKNRAEMQDSKTNASALNVHQSKYNLTTLQARNITEKRKMLNVTMQPNIGANHSNMEENFGGEIFWDDNVLNSAEPNDTNSFTNDTNELQDSQRIANSFLGKIRSATQRDHYLKENSIPKERSENASQNTEEILLNTYQGRKLRKESNPFENQSDTKELEKLFNSMSSTYDKEINKTEEKENGGKLWKMLS